VKPVGATMGCQDAIAPVASKTLQARTELRNGENLVRR
jgi:hypothetical protein